MKVGADGVTLGAWTSVGDAKNILDVGCGSGLIALMLAQRSAAQITAIDVEKDCVSQSRENIERSAWSNRIEVEHVSFQNFALKHTEQFDLIVSNPPFFTDSLKNPSEKRSLARHADSLPHLDLLINAIKLLHDEGRLCLILPIEEGEKLIDQAGKLALFCSKKTILYPNYTRPPKRVLLEFCKKQVECAISKLTIEKERAHYTEEYESFVRDFYLKCE